MQLSPNWCFQGMIKSAAMVETIQKDQPIREKLHKTLFFLSNFLVLPCFSQIKHSLQYLKGDLMALILRYLLKESVKDAMKGEKKQDLKCLLSNECPSL